VSKESSGGAQCFVGNVTFFNQGSSIAVTNSFSEQLVLAVPEDSPGCSSISVGHVRFFNPGRLATAMNSLSEQVAPLGVWAMLLEDRP